MSEKEDVVDELSPEDRATCERLKKNYAEYPAHPYAELNPTTGDEDFQNVVSSVESVGVQKDVVLAKIPGGRDYAVLDGRTRIKACVSLWERGIFKAKNGEAIEPGLFRLATDDPKEMLDHVKASSARRNLSAGQRAAVAVLIDAQENQILKDAGTPRLNADGRKEDYKERWERLRRDSGANHTYLQHCMQMLRHRNCRNLLDSVSSGAMSISEARKRMERRLEGLPDVEENDGGKAGETGETAGGGDGKAEEDKKDILDEDGVKHQGHLGHVFDEAAMFDTALRHVTAATKVLNSIFASPAGSCVEEKVIRDAIKELRSAIRAGRPLRACRMCKGKEKFKGGKCPACEGNRFESEGSFKAAVARGVMFTDAMAPVPAAE